MIMWAFFPNEAQANFKRNINAVMVTFANYVDKARGSNRKYDVL